jgi:alpha-L-rhamnosidase
MGATTIWERWDYIRPDGTINPSGMTSLNHYALGAVVDWMHRTIGGLTAVEPGYRHMRIAPQPGGGLSHAHLRHHTVHGEVRISWSITDRTVTLEATIPVGTTAEVRLPLHPDSPTIGISGGTHQWSYQMEDQTAAGAVFTLDSTLGQIAGNARAWRAFTDAFASHFPGVPLDGTAPEAAVMSVRTMLDYVPGASDELKTDLTTALSSVSQGAHA